MSLWRCPQCGHFLSNRRARPYGEGYAATWVSVGDCDRHGAVSPHAAWEDLWGDFDPETTELETTGIAP